MMRQMRENTKWIMLITALAFVALMVFEWGMDATGRSGAQMSGGEIGRIDGRPVIYDEYIGTYRNLYDQQQAANPDQPITSAMNRQIEDAAWQQLVMQKLIAQELERRGIDVTDEEVLQAARNVPPQDFVANPMFQTDGQFDINKYRAFLASPGVDNQLLLQLEAYYRDMIPRSKLYFQVVAGTYPSDGELWAMYRDATETATVRFLAFDPNLLVPDAAVSVSDAEIRSYYDAHEEDLQRPAQAEVRFIALSRAPTAADSADVRARADSLRAALAGGADFAAAAARFSSDSVSATDGGRLTIRRGQTVEAFDAAAFSRPLDQVGEPVRTQYGWHVLRVEARGGDSAVVRHILLPIERSAASDDALLARADSIDALTESRSFDDIARTFSLQPASATFNEDFPFIAAVGAVDEGAEWVFDEQPDAGTVSPVLENQTSYYVLELVNRTSAGTIPLADARAAIRTRLMTQKKLERARQIANDALERLARGESLEAVARAHGVEVQDAGPFTRADFVAGMGRANAAIGTAFGLQPGQRSGVVEADEMLFIIESVDRTVADQAEWEAQKAQQRAQATAGLQEQRWNQFLAALEENATIVDSRALLRAQASQPPPTGPFGF